MLAECPQSRPGAGLPAVQHHQERAGGPGSDLLRASCCSGGWGQSRQEDIPVTKTAPAVAVTQQGPYFFAPADVAHMYIKLFQL